MYVTSGGRTCQLRSLNDQVGKRGQDLKLLRPTSQTLCPRYDSVAAISG